MSTPKIFNDAAGAIPATYGGSVALVLDGNGALTFGPELVTNGTFDEDTAGWSGPSVSWDDGELSSTGGGGGTILASPGFDAVAGRSYRVTARIRGAASYSSLQFSFRRRSNLTTNIANVSTISVGTTGATISFIAVPTSSASDAAFTIRFSGSEEIWLDDVSVREIIGYPNRHAVQSSSSLRPLLGRAPVAGVRNLLTRSDEFSHSSWSKVNLALSAGSTILGQTSTRLTDTADASAVYHGLSKGDVGGNARSQGFVVRKGTARYVMLGTNSAANGQATYRAIFDLEAKTASGFNVTASITEIETDVFILTIHSSYDGGDPTGRQHALFLMNGPSYPANLQYQGSGSLSIDVLRAFSSRTSSISISGFDQRVGASTLDVTEAGLAAPGYLRFDLVDDRLVHTFPSGFDGDLLIFGRSGSWVQEGVTVAPGGTLTIGPTAVPGAPTGLLAALGDIVGWLPVGRGTTQAERNKMRDYYMARGAKGFLVPGPEQVTNGTFDTDISGWSDRSTGTASIAWDDGTLKTSSTNSSNRGTARQDIPALITGRFYLVSAEVVSTPSTVLIGGGVNNSTNNVFGMTRSTPGIVRLIFLKPTGTFGIALQGAEPGNTRFDNASVRELRPEEEW
jgi:hypothetical protein